MVKCLASNQEMRFDPDILLKNRLIVQMNRTLDYGSKDEGLNPSKSTKHLVAKGICCTLLMCRHWFDSNRGDLMALKHLMDDVLSCKQVKRDRYLQEPQMPA